MDNLVLRERQFNEQKIQELKSLVEIGLSVKDIATKLGLEPWTVYYWLEKIELNPRLVKSKKAVPIKEPKPKKFTYYYYIQTAYKKGQMTLAERNRALNQFYQNRKRAVIEECSLMDL